MYEELIKLVPELQGVLSQFASQPDQLEPFISAVSIISMLHSHNLLTRSQLSTHTSSARQEDTGSLKHDIIQYLMAEPSRQTVNPPITKNDEKSRRGFNHPVTARLLCPIQRIPKFDRDPR